MRVVLDTGVSIAALITPKGPPDLVFQAWRKKRFELITSEWQIAEFRRASRYDKLRPYLTLSEVGNMVNGLRRHAVMVKKLPDVQLSSDAADNAVLATAIAGKADFLITGDKRGLLALKKVDHVRILTARQFLSLTGRHGKR